MIKHDLVANLVINFSFKLALVSISIVIEAIAKKCHNDCWEINIMTASIRIRNDWTNNLSKPLFSYDKI